MKQFLSVLLFLACLAGSSVDAQTVDVSPPLAYASDDWLTTGATSWPQEVTRRDRELNAYLYDDDKGRALKYGFREGQNPALAWSWFDQHPIGYGGMPYVLLQTLLSLDPATETDPHLLRLAKIWKKKTLVADEKTKDLSK